MRFVECDLSGAMVLEPEPVQDDRGHFARLFCRREFEAHGLNPCVAQANVAFNRLRGTVRGLHFQYPPAAESKLVRCTRGAILDVIVDLRPESPTFLRHVAVEISAANRRSLYIPERFAHGYQTLEDGTETSYLVGEFYAPEFEGGLLHDDPRLGIAWPLAVAAVSAKDRRWAPLADVEPELVGRMTAPASR
jgi:dTDP-4-dehydrorhamnose 3,5-epimerase